MNLQEICKEIAEQLEKFNFLEHVRRKAGRLHDNLEHYMAIFEFKTKNTGKLIALSRYLNKTKDYYTRTEFIFNRHKIIGNDDDLWQISLGVYKGKPSEQQADLEKSLHTFLKDLRQYKNSH